MGIFATVFGLVTTIITYLILIAAVQKIFAMSKDLSEIKEILREGKRERDAAAIVTGTYRPAGDESTQAPLALH